MKMTREEIDNISESLSNEELIKYIVRYSEYVRQGNDAHDTFTVDDYKEILDSVKAEALKRMQNNHD